MDKGVERMAALWWSASEYELSAAAESINDVMNALASHMPEHGFEGVAVADDVHGYLPGVDFVVAIQYLPITEKVFWQVIAIGGDGTADQANAEMASIQSIIDSLEFL
jgi:hypothetical protein